MFSAAEETIPRGCKRNCTHDGMKSKSLYKDFIAAPNRPESRKTTSTLLQKLDEEKHRRRNEAVQSIDFTLPTLIVEHGALLTTLLVTPDTHLAMPYFCK